MCSYSVWTALEETDHVSVTQTSEVLAVSTAPPPTNMDHTVTQVSLTCHLTGCCDKIRLKAHLRVHSLSLYPWTV